MNSYEEQYHGLTQEQIEEKIKSMSHLEMAKMWRFAPVGHIYFDLRLPYWKVFEERWEKFGGMTPKISKHVGLEK